MTGLKKSIYNKNIYKGIILSTYKPSFYVLLFLITPVFSFYLNAQQTAFNGTPAVIPGNINACDFDNGGEGIAFHDSDITNRGNAYRLDTSVDIEPANEGGFNVGWIESGEWLEYTVNVVSGSTYNISFRVASESGGGTFHLEFDGNNVTKTITVPATGGWQTYITVVVNNIELSAGQQIMRLYFESSGFNFLYADFKVNNAPVLNELPKGPAFSVKHGFYDNAFDLYISYKTEGAKIKYTLDGTSPITSSTAVTGNSPLKINVNPSDFSGRDKAPGVVITACAFKDGSPITQTKSQTYLFLNKIIENSPDGQRPGSGWLPTNNSYGQAINYGLDPDIYNNAAYKSLIQEGLLQIPSLSIVADLNSFFGNNTGIYYHPNSALHGIEWERPVSLELLNPDGTDGFSINCGIRIRGGWSRNENNPKRAFRFFFREEYGEKELDYPLFGAEGTDKFDKIDLRTSMNYSWAYEGSAHNTMLRDVFSRDLQRDMGNPYTRSRYYHLYINGTYWGLYQTQERSEASFAAEYMDGDRDDYDVVKVNAGYPPESTYNIEATDGNLDAWRRLWEFATYTGFEKNENYFKVQGLNTDGSVNPEYEKLLDVDNLIDYMIIVFFTGDFDAPISNFSGNQNPNNYYAVYNRNKPDGFKFFRHDAEHSLFDETVSGVNGAWGVNRTGPFPAGSTFEKSNPQWIHQQLVVNANYRKRFADRTYKHFYNDGALTLENTRSIINTRKSQFDNAIILESARWGDSKASTPYNKNNWLIATNYISNNFLPPRANIVIDQLKSKGWVPGVEPPVFNAVSGNVKKGFNLTMNTVSGGKIYYTSDGSDVYEIENNNGSFALVKENSFKKVKVPTSIINADWYSDFSFDDNDWLICSGAPGGIGYERDEPGDYSALISLNVKNSMYGGGSGSNTSCMLRIPFIIEAADLQKINRLTLSAYYDDDFVAYLNGTPVIKGNNSLPLLWNAKAAANHEAENWETFDISDFIANLKAGDNLLAIQALNVDVTSSDFIINVKLTGESKITGGILTASAKEYSAPEVIENPVKIIARTINNEEWSAMNQITLGLVENYNDLKITELHYHPLGEVDISDTEFEFIELKNIGEVDLNLGLVSFIDGISYTFSADAVIKPDSFIVLASNAKMFFQRYGFNPYGEYEGQLNNGGELITVVTATNDTIFNFSYKDSAPWPTEADGLGYSLVSKLLTPIYDPDNPEYWTLSAEINGSPGKDESYISIATVYINEVLSHTDKPYVDAVEIYNPNDAEVNIGGWYLTDDKTNPLKWKIPLGKIIPAKGYLVLAAGHYEGDQLLFDEDEFGASFQLNAHGDMVYIISANEAGEKTGYRHGFEFGEIENGATFGRYVNSINEEHFVKQREVTLGSENAGPLVGPVIINRIMYNPDYKNYEFLEIINISGVSVNLYHSQELYNTWRINGAGFKFPENITIEPNENIFIIDSNVVVNTFRSAYGLTEDVQIFNMSGSLSNSGETITVQMPADEYELNGKIIVPYMDVDKVKYNDKLPWPVEADGAGSGLLRISKTDYANDPINWTIFTSSITEIKETETQLPAQYQLSQNYPNPFNPGTTINYSVPEPVFVSIKIYSAVGEEVAVLVNENKNAGNYSLQWLASNLSSGLYFYKITAGSFNQTKKLILLK
ncbi:MAG: hypothetical protein CVV23_12025 [Ignavibacteriae bacterium HGW-Ignavibacteriae-2]|nr:MAG: hypothetical protein CVV23_12025 [Ignavibacteriae bacterium HGW-Ignavibacteriae-2]